jgi:hypothetical protein
MKSSKLIRLPSDDLPAGQSHSLCKLLAMIDCVTAALSLLYIDQKCRMANCHPAFSLFPWIEHCARRGGATAPAGRRSAASTGRAVDCAPTSDPALIKRML